MVIKQRHGRDQELEGEIERECKKMDSNKK
jgi:hypothetical protein